MPQPAASATDASSGSSTGSPSAPRPNPASRRVVGRRREQRQGAQPGTWGRPGGTRRTLHGAQQQPVRLDDLAGSGDGGGRQCRGDGVRVGQDGGGGVDAAGVVAVRGGDRRRLIEQVLQVLAEFAVVEADDQPQPGVEAAGAQRGVDVGLVVVVDQRQCARRGDAGLDQGGVVGLRHLDDPQGLLGRGVPLIRLIGLNGLTRPHRCRTRHRRRHPPEQGGGPSQPARRGGDPRPVRIAGGGDDEGHPFAIDVLEFGGETVRERIVAADHHVRGGGALLGLLGQSGHTS